MARAISTRFIGATAGRGPRIMAWAGPQKRYYPRNYEYNEREDHVRAALRLFDELEWTKNAQDEASVVSAWHPNEREIIHILP